MSKSNQKVWNIVLSISTLFFVGLSFRYFLKDQLAQVFLGSHPIEMSFRRAMVIDPENAAYFFRMGTLRDKLAQEVKEPIRQRQRYQDALVVMKKAIELNPYQIAYRSSYGDLALKAGFPEKGEEVYNFKSFEFDAEFYLSQAFYDFKQAGVASDAVLREKFLNRGIESLKQARLFGGDFTDQIFQRKVKILPDSIQTELSNRGL